MQQLQPLILPMAARDSRTCRLAHNGEAAYSTFSQFISTVFRKSYDAKVMVSYPTLIGICGSDGTPKAVLGLRGAEEEPLFLERYLDVAAERAVEAQEGIHIFRHEIAEAGNLASTHVSALKDLMFALSLSLKQQGYRYILFTGTQSLKQYLESLGLRPRIYAFADPSRLGHDAANWGRYYETKPLVMGGTVDEFYYGLLGAYRRKDVLQ